MASSSARPVKRLLVLGAAVPFAFFGYNVFPVAAATPTCAGQPATIVVSSHSAHTVRGSSHRDVIVVHDAGHVVRAAGGNDLVCGSGGHDVIHGGSGSDRIMGSAGRDALWGGSGPDEMTGGSGDDQLEGQDGDD